ncbi:phosphomannose isomerase type I-like protein [Bacteriovorax sp. BAL6_X]|uniref:type I phosphomannose isomerase catalytic subunit n=1 Tax=Bacteriovorax sp. BAL6_X TaxID=1201290 RepID=UPI0003856BA8|nr:type I phosphomannose isomerase catalytic subunit [Bacteriovorax sp. BAL6_X]EPZ49766.1 phosphomannose isomerase type I-like protein [Bacteriovorax sp. BAL6_X]
MILKQIPHLVSTVWGGEKLKKYKDPEGSFDGPLGETWEVSTLENGLSLCENKQSLEEALEGKILTYLIKFIDTNKNLSIQVHPDNEYAHIHEDALGKDECWYILDAENNAGIYLGLKDEVTKERLQEAIESGENVNELLNFINVQKGDFFNIPAGSIHAIGEGVTLVEVQQSSGVTYRVWDWNRMGLDGKPRELHVKKAMDVINFKPSANKLEYFQYKNLDSSGLLTSNNYFNARIKVLKAGDESVLSLNGISSIVMLEGTCEIDDTEINEYESAVVKDIESAILKAITDSKVLVVKQI